MLLVFTSGFYALIGFSSELGLTVALLVGVMTCLGLGSGAVFQLVPGRFPKEIGVATGVVGALGGLGGFFLPIVLGNAKDIFGSYASGLLLFAVLALGTFVALRVLAFTREGWRSSWLETQVLENLNPNHQVANRVLMAPYLLP